MATRPMPQFMAKAAGTVSSAPNTGRIALMPWRASMPRPAVAASSTMRLFASASVTLRP